MDISQVTFVFKAIDVETMVDIGKDCRDLWNHMYKRNAVLPKYAGKVTTNMSVTFRYKQIKH